MAYKRELIAKTKNLFNYSGKLRQYYDIDNGTIIETLPNGAILQGNVYTGNGDASYSNGWFRPGYTSGYGTEVTLSANDTVTISADYEILERNFISPTIVGIYLYGTEELSSLNDFQVETGVLYRVKQTYTIAKDGQYYPVFTLNSSKVKITNIQIEKGSTATDYVPYGHLPSYKKLLKVSDVCQLLDKSKYLATQTASGVTFTNNEDGTITVNGTASSNIYLDIIFYWLELSTDRKYLIIGCPSGGNFDKYFLYVNNGGALWDCDIGNGSIGTPIKQHGVITIAISKGVVVNNLVFKPQLFDLTEMFGAGNEPTTVDEFKAKFPNELYDYSPRCWVKAYKTGLIAKTKNLFNVNALTPYTPETLPTETAGRYNGNIITKCGSGTSIGRSGKLLKELCPNMVAGERYILHFDTDGTWHQATTIYLYGSLTAWTKDTTHVVTEAELNGVVAFYGNYPSLDVATISNFQIEKGTTATDYVLYGYL